jgi:hypothetical protein
MELGGKSGRNAASARVLVAVEGDGTGPIVPAFRKDAQAPQTSPVRSTVGARPASRPCVHGVVSPELALGPGQNSRHLAGYVVRGRMTQRVHTLQRRAPTACVTGGLSLSREPRKA